MVLKKGLQSTRTTKVKGHADDEMVDKDGSDQAHEAADLGLRHVDDCVIDRRRVFSQACHVWHPSVCDLRRFFISVVRVFGNNDDKSGTSLDPIIWFAGSLPKKARSIGLLENLLGFLGLLTFGRERQGWPDVGVTWHDVPFWPCSACKNCISVWVGSLLSNSLFSF